MRKKAGIGLLLLVFFFGFGGWYIAKINDTAINGLEKILALSQMGFLRDDLFNKVKIVQADLYLTTSPHNTGVADFVTHGEALYLVGEKCVGCHHAEPVRQRIDSLRNDIDGYLKKASRIYLLRANQARRDVEEKIASAAGARLLGAIDSLVIFKPDSFSSRTSEIRQEILRTKHLLLGLLIVVPLFCFVLLFLFIKRFSSSLSVLLKATEKIKAGELTHTIEEPLFDEFQTLADAFNGMVTSLKKQCEAVVSEQNRYKVLFESAHDAIFVFEAEGERIGGIVAANKAAALMHGYSAEELQALSIQDLDVPQSAAEVPVRIQHLLKSGQLEMLVEHRRKDGSVFPVEVRAGVLEVEGHKYVLAFGRDVTMRVQTQAALQRARQLAIVGEMAAGLAHEIKNPLAGIKVSMEVLMSELALSPEDQDVFSRIIGEVQRIESLLKNLLNYARTPKPLLAWVDMNQPIENAMKNFLLLLNAPGRAASEGGRPEVICHLDPALPRVMADSAQVQQVILNLLLNAVEAMPAGGTITVSTKAGQGETVEVAICDTGKGLDEEARAKIFQPFYTTKPKGNGLGLAITKRLVEQHQGEITVASVLGQGTTFTVTLPVNQKSEDESHP